MLDQLTEIQPLHQFAEKAYLDYSMYVILDRALPHIGDGLKPVQRRIIYAMSELGLKAAAKYKKSARTVGDVLGKYHPHGDSACYEAMVLMAQHFSYRYPLVDGQGNWGSMDDPKSFAAMRYTEAKLSAFAELLLSELAAGTVDWVPNFDGTLTEPQLLPARVPHILLNGTTGIAVGMATDIPPHNLSEIIDGCLAILDNKKITVKELHQIIPAPDYPTDAEIITPAEELLALYETGQGMLRMRATYIKEDGNVIINALPHQVSGAKVVEQIAKEMQAKALPMIADLRDESDHENPTRLVIEPRSNRVDIEPMMQHLFAKTDLEKSYRVNMNMIGTDGKPDVKNLAKILSEWVDWRTQIVTRRLQHRLEKVLNRLHILDGLMIAFLNIDEVIRIIRHEDDPKQKLMQQFKLSDKQAEAILDLKLRHLAKLEEIKIKSEQSDLNKERETLEKTLGSSTRLKTLIKKELLLCKEQFGDARRSPLVVREPAKAQKLETQMASWPVTVVLSEKGWVRSAKGHEVDGSSLSYKSGDHFKMQALGQSTEPALFIDTTGRSYMAPAHQFPSARGFGDPLSGRFDPPSGALFTGVFIAEEKTSIVLASGAGYGFLATVADLHCKNKKGKQLITVPKGFQAVSPYVQYDDEANWLALLTQSGHLLVIPIDQLPEMAKGKGNKLIQIPPKERDSNALIDICLLAKKDDLQVQAGKRTLTLAPKDWKKYQGERAQRGLLLPKGYRQATGFVRTEFVPAAD